MIKFCKLHGCGNDFIAIDENEYKLDDYGQFAQKVCHRKFGIGADGLLVSSKSEIADCKMIYYNSDGSIANMCGNGIRCFSKFVYEKNIVNKKDILVETLDGVKKITLDINNEKVESIRVNMGYVTFEPNKIPVDTNKLEFINEKIKVLDKEFVVSTILVGVPHTMIYVDDIDKTELVKYGQAIERHDIFPRGTNVNFVKVLDKQNIYVSTFERGCGYTFACGTGICASSYMSYKLNKTDKNVNVKCEGGSLYIEIVNDEIYMNGPAVKICEGILEV